MMGAAAAAPAAGQTQSDATTAANKAIAQKLDEVVKEFGEGVVKQCLTGGDCPVAVSLALAAVKSLMESGTGDGEQAPNLGKDEDAKDIAGGGGNSASPGGWGPDDEENARNEEAANEDYLSAEKFFEGSKYTDKVKEQSSSGDYHSFPEFVDGFANQGTVTKIVGGDGVTRLKLEIPGEYNGKMGVFEYIKNPDGTINYRLFVPKD